MALHSSFLHRMPNLICPVYASAKKDPNKIAIISPEKTLTYQEFNSAIENLCKTLQKQGIQPQMRIAFIARPSLSCALFLLALFRLHAIACPLSFRTPSELIPRLINECNAHFFLSAEDFPINTNPSHSKTPIYAKEQLATFLMTSGSSGKSKVACHTIQNHLTSALSANDFLNCDNQSRYLFSLTPFHVGGIAILLRTILAQATLVISSDKLLDTFISQKITHASLVPTQLFRLIQEDKENIKNTSLQCLLIGGAALSIPLAKQALEYKLPIFTTYGMTETSSMITAIRLDSLSSKGDVGKPLAYTDLKIEKDFEIRVKGETLFQGYWDCKTEKIIDPRVDGWFPTQDLGSINNQGNLIFLGRKDRVFISGGENIHPKEIEDALCQIPGIVDARVIPIDDTEFGKRPIAHILEDPTHPSYPHTLESIRKELKPLLESFKHPVEICKMVCKKSGIGTD